MPNDGSTALYTEVGRLKEDVDMLKEKCITHELRLANGEKAFIEIRGKMPTPMSAPKLLSFAFAIFVTAAGALWTLSAYLSERPTHSDAEKSFLIHDKNGHKDLRGEVQEIRQEQAAQREIIKNVEKGIDEQDHKLDVLLEQTAPRRRNRRR